MNGRQSFIYVVEAQNGMLKIGVSANPSGRAATIHQHSPVPVRLIARWVGDIRDEQVLHREFAAYRSHGEWFRIAGEVIDFAARNKGRGVTAVPEWADITCPASGNRAERSRSVRSAKAAAKWANPAWRRKHWIECRVGRAWRRLWSEARESGHPAPDIAIRRRLKEEAASAYDEAHAAREPAA